MSQRARARVDRFRRDWREILRRRKEKVPTWIWGVITFYVGYLLNAYVEFIPLPHKMLGSLSWTSAIVGAAAIGAVVWPIWGVIKYRLMRDALKISATHNQMLLTVQNSVDNLLTAPDKDFAAKQIITSLFEEHSLGLGGITCRGSVMVPDASRLFLEPYVLDRIPPSDNYKGKFYIGDDVEAEQAPACGVVGWAFHTGQTQIARIVHHPEPGVRFTFDHPKWVEVNPSRRPPPYESFITEPVISKFGGKYGVLCLDARERNRFDNGVMRQVTKEFASSIAAVLDIHDLLPKSPQRPPRGPE